MRDVSGLSYVKSDRAAVKEVELLGNTGAFCTIILAEELWIKPIAKTGLMLADKRKVEADTALAYIKILDRDAVLQIAIMEVSETSARCNNPLGLRVDPSTGKTEHSRPYGAALFQTDPK